MSDFSTKEVSVDIVFGGLGKTGEFISGAAQKGLLDAFQTAASLDDVAARLAIPIQMLTVTGAKVVTAHGYDAYKITIAIRSDDPYAVAKEIFSTATGIAATGVFTPLLRIALTPTPLGPLGTTLGATGLGIGLGAVASEFSKSVWDDYIANSMVGKWSTAQLTDTFGIGLKISNSASAIPTIALPPVDQAPRSALILDPTDGKAKVAFHPHPRPTWDPDVVDTPNTYLVQKGDSLWKIAQTNGWNYEDIKVANPQITDPNFIRAGQKIYGLAPVDIANIVSTATHTISPTVGVQVSDPTVSSASEGIAAESAGFSVRMNEELLNKGTSYYQGIISDSATNGIRPGAVSVSTTSSLIDAVRT